MGVGARDELGSAEVGDGGHGMGDELGCAEQEKLRFPGEWEQHERTLLSWPYRDDLWLEHLEEVKKEHAALAKAIVQYEPVLVIADPGSGDEAQEMCGPLVDVVEFPIDDSWIRDNGPLVVYGPDGRIGLDFEFNGWGEKFAPWDSDDALPPLVCDELGLPVQKVDMVLEGGAVILDGEGTLITTEECLLNPNRNPDMSKAEMEEVLEQTLGATKVVWLPWGIYGDWITDGHVDGVAAYAAPAVVFAQSVPEGRKNTPDGKRLAENRAVLSAAKDAQGRSFTIIDFPLLPELEIHGEWTSHSYLNFYVLNSAVVVPLAGVPEDQEALLRIADAFPDREIVGVKTRTLTWGGGGVHCVTQQVPAGN